jgi:alkylation response protein AidB-like acyl-CoA dehydrogenase
MSVRERAELFDIVGAMLGDRRLRGETGGWAPSLWSALEDAGFTRLGVAEAVGGSGGDVIDAVTALVAAGAAAAAVPLAESTLLGGWLLEEAGLPVPDGPLAVVPAGHLALRPDGAWSLTGRAPRVAWIRAASHIAVLASAGDAPAVAVVPAARCTVRPGTDYAGQFRDDVEFAGVPVEPDDVVRVAATVPQALRLRGALSRTALMAGAVSRVLTATVSFTEVRHQFGRPIARFQVVQHDLAALAAETVAARAALRGAVSALVAAGDDAVRAWRPIAAAKVRVGLAAGRAAAIGHQLHGAIGFTMEHPLHEWTARLWAWRDEYGSEAVWAERIGADVARRGSGGLDTAFDIDDDGSLSGRTANGH